MVRKTLAVLMLFTVFCFVAAAQEGDQQQERREQGDGEPAWVTYQRGNQALNDGRFGDALQRYREALSARRPFPEAEAGLGRVFEAEGNYNLAERQYKKALEDVDDFYVAEERYSVRYYLADLYRNQERRKNYEETLSSIAEDDPQFSADHDPPYRELLPDILTRENLEDRPQEPRLDVLLRLYRLDANFAHRAHLELGEALLANGQFSPAVDHLAFASVGALSAMFEVLRRETYDYELESAVALIEDALAEESLRRFIGEAEPFKSLYRLGGALWGLNPASDVPEEIWETVAAFPDAAGVWAARASRAIEDPERATIVDY
ncbi:MAG: tetratricopeptide repeat protein [Spirochaetota bacterium]